MKKYSKNADTKFHKDCLKTFEVMGKNVVKFVRIVSKKCDILMEFFDKTSFKV